MKRRVAEAVVGSLTVAAMNAIPPLAVEAFGHGLKGIGLGLKHAGIAVEKAGRRTVQYAHDQRDRPDWGPNPTDPGVVTIGGVRYKRDDGYGYGSGGHIGSRGHYGFGP